MSVTNPAYNQILFPQYSNGIAVCNNLNGPGASPTFYTVVQLGGTSIYYYYNGSTWVNTGHFAGGSANIGAGKDYIFNLNNGNGDVYRYDGTGDAVYIATVPPGGADIIADDSDNFYVISLDIAYPPYGFLKYNSNGVLVQTWAITGSPVFLLGAGLAALGGKIYYYDNVNIQVGVFNGPTLNFSPISPPITATTPTNLVVSDLGSCPWSPPRPKIYDTLFHCPGSPDLTLTASGSNPIIWSVLNGTATITGSGKTVMVAADSTATILASHPLVECDTPTVIDTFFIVVPRALVDAGPPQDTLNGCGSYLDTLQAHVWDTTAGVTYYYSWTPLSAIASGDSSLQPIIDPVAGTTYVLTVSTPPNQGGCIWVDSTHIEVRDFSSQPGFTYLIHYGCEEDTVIFQNTSTGADHYHWSFGDNTGDTIASPTHIYKNQSNYLVKLESINKICQDTLLKFVDIQHPLIASFNVDDDSICIGAMMSLTNTSTYTQINGPAHFLWSYGDATSDTGTNATHTFLAPGIYNMSLIATDFIPCSDTAYHLAVVDSLPVISFAMDDSTICEGKEVVFTADYTMNGVTSLVWDFGTGDSIVNHNPILHAFDTSGTFTVAAIGRYRSCADTSFHKLIDIVAYPRVDLGPDTSMCPNSEAITIGDYINKSGPNARWLWNTGDTTAFIRVRHPGIYTTRVLIHNCANDDSIEVFKDCYLDIPNAFTPNGDGINDYFLPRQLLSKGLTEYRMSIFNRWGQLIFETDNIDGRGWDGDFNGLAQPQGVYVYLIKAAFKNGTSEKYQGNVTLMR